MYASNPPCSLRSRISAASFAKGSRPIITSSTTSVSSRTRITSVSQADIPRSCPLLHHPSAVRSQTLKFRKDAARWVNGHLEAFQVGCRWESYRSLRHLEDCCRLGFHPEGLEFSLAPRAKLYPGLLFADL